MIRIKDNTLIIEIRCPENVLPLENLGELKSGIIDLFSIIDYINAPKNKVEWSVRQLNALLQEMSFSPEQMGVINDKIIKNPVLNSEFNML
jgi:hypothetical protein